MTDAVMGPAAMGALPERSPERDEAVEAMLPFVPGGGWTVRTLQEAAGPDADLLFPGGPADMVECFCDLADRYMAADAAALDMAALRTHERVQAVLGTRFARWDAHKEAVRRAVGVLALPGRQVLAARCTARTVDAAWVAAGDEATGFARHSKRAILAGVYGATLLFWLRDGSPDGEDTFGFLGRRLRDAGRIGKLRARLSGRGASRRA